MAEKLVIVYPPEPLIIDLSNMNIKKEIEAVLYNKTSNKILYEIIPNNKNYLTIENSKSVINPFKNQNIKFYFNNIEQNKLNKNDKYELIIYFYVLKKNEVGISNFDKLLKEKRGKENQKTILNINLINKSLREINRNEEYNKDIIQKYSKFKSDLKEINNTIKNIINSKNNKEIKINKIKYKIVLTLLVLTIFFGFLSGLKIKKKYNSIFKSSKRKVEIVNIDKKNINDDNINIKFMSAREADVIDEIYNDNIIKLKSLKDFNILNEARKKRKVKV
jgi:hypothetical protein